MKIRPLTDRVVARAVWDARRADAGSRPPRLPFTARVVLVRMQPFVRRAATWIVRSDGAPSLRDDVVQDALMVLGTRLGRLERVSVAGLEAFAFGVVRHRARTLAERERRRRGTDRPSAREPVDPDPGPADLAIRRDSLRSIRRAASTLRPVERRVAEMLLRGNDSRGELARRLGISVPAAAMRKSRVLRVLREAASP